MIIKTKTCSKCGETKSIDEFYKNKSRKSGECGKRGDCKECNIKKAKKYRQEHREEAKRYSKEYRQEHKDEIRQKKGTKSMYENKLCASYLGVVIAERLVRHLFKNVEVMPHNNPKFDFICNRNKKIDVKSACITLDRGRPRWVFIFNLNKIADYFICVAFDNRTDLNPLHLWMIPGKEINTNSGKSIRPSTIHKWDKWKQDITDAQLCCNEIKNKGELKWQKDIQ